jgi:hypothetical protein
MTTKAKVDTTTVTAPMSWEQINQLIDEGADKWKQAAIGIQEQFRANPKMTQGDIALRVGKSRSWVNQVLKWDPEKHPDGPFAAKKRQQRDGVSQSNTKKKLTLVHDFKDAEEKMKAEKQVRFYLQHLKEAAEKLREFAPSIDPDDWKDFVEEIDGDVTHIIGDLKTVKKTEGDSSGDHSPAFIGTKTKKGNKKDTASS